MKKIRKRKPVPAYSVKVNKVVDQIDPAVESDNIKIWDRVFSNTQKDSIAKGSRLQ